jgi:hypothetical protein
MDTSQFRRRAAPLPRSLNVSPKSDERWRVAHSIAQRLADLDYNYALTKIGKYSPEMRPMIRLRLDAQRRFAAEWFKG